MTSSVQIALMDTPATQLNRTIAKGCSAVVEEQARKLALRNRPQLLLELQGFLWFCLTDTNLVRIPRLAQMNSRRFALATDDSSSWLVLV